MSESSSGVERSEQAVPPRIEDLVRSRDAEDLRTAASSPALNEDLALALLARRDLPGAVLEEISRNQQAMKHRKVILAVVRHPRAPRHVSLPAARRLYTFELMQISRDPAVAADLKIAVEDTLITRLETISSGERLTLARRASGHVAAALLADADPRIVAAALSNPFMTEGLLLQALAKDDVSDAFVTLVCHDAKWSARRDVRIALLRNPKTPLAHLLAFAQSLPAATVRHALQNSPLPHATLAYLHAELERRSR